MVLGHSSWYRMQSHYSIQCVKSLQHSEMCHSTAQCNFYSTAPNHSTAKCLPILHHTLSFKSVCSISNLITYSTAVYYITLQHTLHVITTQKIQYYLLVMYVYEHGPVHPAEWCYRLGVSVRYWVTQWSWKQISLEWMNSRHTPREQQQHMLCIGPKPRMLRPRGISAHPCTLSVWCDPYEPTQ
jgi:hypothetical protein